MLRPNNKPLSHSAINFEVPTPEYNVCTQGRVILFFHHDERVASFAHHLPSMLLGLFVSILLGGCCCPSLPLNCSAACQSEDRDARAASRR